MVPNLDISRRSLRMTMAQTATELQPGVQRAPTLLPLLPWSLASALLLYLCYFPVAWGWLGWVALCPLLVIVRSRARTLFVFLAAWLAGLLFYYPVLQWMRVADPRMYATWIMMAFYLSWYFPAAVFLLRALERRKVPLVASLPVVCVTLEFVRAYVMGGFAWYFLAHTQHDFLPLIQISDITGSYGVSALVAAVNAVVFEWLWQTAHRRGWLGEGSTLPRRPTLVFQSALVLALFAAFLLYGTWRMAGAEFKEGPSLALVQTGTDQDDKNNAASLDLVIQREAQAVMLDQNEALSRLAGSQRSALVIWPETSWSHEWTFAKVPDLESQDFAFKRAQGHGGASQLLIGLNSQELMEDNQTPKRRFNSAVLIDAQGRYVDRYDKIHRVPFGEYVPLRDTLPFLKRFAPYDFEYSIVEGEGQRPLPLGAYRFGVLICYEDTDSQLARKYAAPEGDKPPDFIVNISNDGWFKGTAEHDEHLAICRFRAIECRRAVARSVNLGISAMIDGNGRVLAPEAVSVENNVTRWEIGANATSLPLARWQEFKLRPGVIFATVPLDTRSSLYGRWGDWFPWLCVLVVFILLVGRNAAGWRPGIYLLNSKRPG